MNPRSISSLRTASPDSSARSSSANAALIAFIKAVGPVSAVDVIRFGVNPGPTLTDQLQKRCDLRAVAELDDATQWP